MIVSFFFLSLLVLFTFFQQFLRTALSLPSVLLKIQTDNSSGLKKYKLQKMVSIFTFCTYFYSICFQIIIILQQHKVQTILCKTELEDPPIVSKTKIDNFLPFLVRVRKKNAELGIYILMLTFTDAMWQ